MILIHLAYGFIVRMFLSNFSETSIVVTIVNTLFGFIKFYFFMIAMVAMAPVAKDNKFKAGIGLSIVPPAIGGGFIFLSLYLSRTSLDEMYYSPTMAILQIGIIVLAVIVGLISVKKGVNMEETPIEEQKVEDSL